jgi:sec-independent protein translocase protein TatB
MGSAPPIELATLSMWDTLLLMALALVVFGPRRLPKIGRQLGKLMYEFRKASNDFKFQMEEEFRASEESDRRKKEEEARQRALAAAPPPAQLEAAVALTPAVTEPVTPEPVALDPLTPAPAESPYSEGTNPNIEAEARQAVDPEPPPAPPADPAPAAAAPRIQPPSIGETVSADPPTKSQGNLFPEAEESEPAPHHG